MEAAVYLSFLVPCFNYGQYLSECINSIQNQTFQNWELIILDDASTDNTPEIAKALASEDSRIQYHRHPNNIGHLANYNVGIALAKGELIWLISADDCLTSPTIAKQFTDQFLKNKALGLAFCRIQCIDEHSAPYEKYIPRAGYNALPENSTTFAGHDFFSRLIKENFVPAPGAIARKSCYTSTGNFHPALTHSGDWYNWLLFSLDYDIYYEPEPSVYYRKHQHNMHLSYQKPRQALENTLLCYQELEQHLKNKEYPKRLQRQAKLARVLFMKKNGFALSFSENMLRLSRKLSGRTV